MTTLSVLMIVTSHEKLGETGNKTGFWLEELAAPYLEFVKAGVDVDIASPRGGHPPVDPKSAEAQGASGEFRRDSRAMEKLRHSIPLNEVKRPYDAYFLVGGHGAMWDLAESEVLQGLLSRRYEAGAVVAAVCHGPAGLVGVRKQNGEPLVRGLRVAGFSDEEEEAVNLTAVVLFALESKLRELGGKYERGPMWAPFVVRDGRLVTGQNPASSVAVARETLTALDDLRSAPVASAEAR